MSVSRAEIMKRVLQRVKLIQYPRVPAPSGQRIFGRMEEPDIFAKIRMSRPMK
jgi:hypothetical protein